MIGMNEPVVTIPGWCSRCFRPCYVELGVNEALCLPCETAMKRDIRAGMRARSTQWRKRAAS